MFWSKRVGDKSLINWLICNALKCLQAAALLMVAVKILWTISIVNNIGKNRLKKEKPKSRTTFAWNNLQTLNYMDRTIDAVARQAMQWNPLNGIGRKKGRPCETCRRTVKGECKNLNKTWPDLKQLAQSRVRWRVGTVDALCPGCDQGN